MAFRFPGEDFIIGNNKKLFLTGAFTFAAGYFAPQGPVMPFLPLDIIGASIAIAVAGYTLIGAMKSSDKLEDALDEMEDLPKRQKGALKGTGSSLPEAGISGILGLKGNGIDGFLNAPFSNFVNPIGLLFSHIAWMTGAKKVEGLKATNKQQLLETKLAGLATLNTLVHGFTLGFGPAYFLSSAAILGYYFWKLKQADRKEKLARTSKEQETLEETSLDQTMSSKNKKTASSQMAVIAAMCGVVGLAAIAGAAAMYSIGVGASIAPWVAGGGLTLPLLAAFASSIPEFIFTGKSYQKAYKADKAAKALDQKFNDEAKSDAYYAEKDRLRKESLEDRAEGMQNVMVSALVNMTLVSGMGTGMYAAFGYGNLHLGEVLGSFGLEGMAAFGAVGAVLAPSLMLMAFVLHGSKNEKYDEITGDIVLKSSNPKLTP